MKTLLRMSKMIVYSPFIVFQSGETAWSCLFEILGAKVIKRLKIKDERLKINN